MSSFIGHSLTAGIVYVCGTQGRENGKSTKSLMWLGVLLLAATAPDLDYLVPWLSKNAHGGLRLTHSIAFSLVVPTLVTCGLFALGIRGRKLFWLSLQVTLAGLSHVVLDFCVGVHPMPLFWPLHDAVCKSPVGILPSSGALDLTNFYLYRNLLIELGILVPIYVAVYLAIRGETTARTRLIQSGLVVIAALFVIWSVSLSR